MNKENKKVNSLVLIGARRTKVWNHILKNSIDMRILTTFCLMLIGLVGCSSPISPYAVAYKKSFIGLNRNEALTELISIRLFVEGQRDETRTDFQIKCYKFGDDPVYGMVSGAWSYMDDIQVSMPYKCINEFVKKKLLKDNIASESGVWLCFEYLRPSLHLSFSAEKEALGLWFDCEGIVTNQAVVVREVGP